MRRLWRRIKPWMEGGFRQRVTLTGLFFSMATGLVGVAAFISANNLLFLLLAAMLSTILVSGFVSRLSLAGLEVDFILPDHISARRKINGRIRLHNHKKWMPSFSISLAGSPEAGFSSVVYFPSIPRGSSVEETVEVYFSRRGIFRENSFRFSTRFPFGFAERRVNVTLGGEMLVYPCLDPRPGFEDMLDRLAGQLEQHFRGRGHDFYRIRPYEPLESARHVDWKATAHTGALQVREFAVEHERLVEMFLDLSAAREYDDWFERAVEYCALLAWRISERGARIHFRTQEFDRRLPEECDVYAILKYLALVSRQPGRPPLKPYDQTGFRVVVTVSANRVFEAGWEGAYLLGPEAFSAPPRTSSRDARSGP